MDSFDLTNHFLIAMPSLDDPNFSKTVTYLCAHNDEGAMGIVINRPLEIELAEVFLQMNIESELSDSDQQPVYLGGPVHRDRGFIIHRPATPWESSIQVTNELALSTSRDILEAIGAGTGPQESLVALGYAGWGAGQLEQEMSQNAWLSGPASLEIIFNTPAEQRWQLAAEQMGVNMTAMSTDVGHA
ncbi:MAG: putative transcriptional regulator [Gammaproteobacteria bacterium]|jgi:putative transcriptional regulator